MADPELPDLEPSLRAEAEAGSQPGKAPASRLVLALDTCGAESTLALAELTDHGLIGAGVRLICEQILPARTAGSRLTAAMRDLLGSVPPGALYAIVVVRGPGSFTGMRIGISAAKALSEACALPLVAVSRLAVFSAASHAPNVALDAGRGRVYLGSFASNPAQEQLLDVDERTAVLKQEVGPELRHDLSTGRPPATEARLTVCEARLALLFPTALTVDPPTALDAIRYARPRLASRDWDDAAAMDALYLWRAEQMLTSPVLSA